MGDKSRMEQMFATQITKERVIFIISFTIFLQINKKKTQQKNLIVNGKKRGYLHKRGYPMVLVLRKQ